MGERLTPERWLLGRSTEGAMTEETTTTKASERDRLIDAELAKHPAPTAQSIQEAYEAVERQMAERHMSERR